MKLQMKTRSIKPQIRSIDVNPGSIDKENRTVEFSFSSEFPVMRHDWDLGRFYEILDHSSEAVDLTRLKAGAPILNEHYSDQIGVVEDAWIADDKRGYIKARYSKNKRADEIFQDIADGIRKNVSVGYRVLEMRLEKQEGKTKTYRVTKWEPFEVSNVSVPADPNVGVGRSLSSQQDNEIKIYDEIETTNSNQTKEKRNMANEAGTQTQTQTTTQTQQRNETSPNLEVIRSEAVKTERDRITSIRTLGSECNLSDLAQTHIEQGSSIDEFRKALVEEFKSRKKVAVNTAKPEQIGMNRKEIEEYSIHRAIMASISGDWSKAGLEREASEAVSKMRGKQPEGFFLPLDVQIQRMTSMREMEALAKVYRDMSVGTATAGGNLVATNLLSGSMIDILRNANLLDQLGVDYMTGLAGDLAIPKQTGTSTVYYVAEGEDVSESSPTIGQVGLSPKSMGTFIEATRKFLKQSSIAVEPFIRRELGTVLGLGIQSGLISGTGADGQPTGILNLSSTNSVAGGTNGAAPTYSHIVKLERECDVDNAILGDPKYLTNSKVRAKLKLTEKFSGTNGNPVWESGNELNGYQGLVTNAVPSNLTKGNSGAVCSAIIYGSFRTVVIGLWSGIDIIVNPYANDKSGGIRITALQDYDLAFRYQQAFAIMNDALTTIS